MNEDKPYVEIFYEHNDIDKLVNYVTNNNNTLNKHTYFNLATTNGVGGAEENLLYRYCIAFDFDLCDFLGINKELMYKFDRDTLDRHKSELLCHIYKKVNDIGHLPIHYTIDSGYGYHIYFLISRTNNIEMVNEVQSVLCDMLGADKNAKKKTQILRVPITYNIKGTSYVTVNIVKDCITNNKKFERYDINKLYTRFCLSKSKYTEVKEKSFVRTDDMYICIEDKIKNGSKEGCRDKDLVNIVVALRNKGLSLEEILNITKQWDIKSNFNDNTEYRVRKAYEQQRGFNLNCNNCINKSKCYNRINVEFEFNDEFGTIVMFDKHMKLCKKPKIKKYKEVKGRSGKVSEITINELSGNEILLMNVLKYNDGELSTSKFMEELTYTKKKKVKNVAMTEPTFLKTIKLLEHKGIVSIIKGNSRAKVENKYKLIDVNKCRIENTIEISYMVTLAVIWGIISPAELKLYILMRYIQKQQQKESLNNYSGALFRMNQSDLAKFYYGSDSATNKGHISEMIESLIESKILKIWSIDKDDRGRDYYTYKLAK